jgi:ATP-binding cassette subfamily B protein
MNPNNFIISIVRPYHKYLLIVLIFQTIGTLCITGQAYIIKIIIDLMTGYRSTESIFHIKLFAVIFVVNILIIRSSNIFFETILTINFLPKIKQEIQMQVIRKLFKHSLNFYSNNFCGSLVSKINDIADGIIGLINVLIDRFLITFLVLVSSISTIQLVGSKYTIIIVLWVSIFILISYKLSYHIKILAKASSLERSRVTGIFTDVISNMQDVRLFTNYRLEYNNILTLICRSNEANMLRDWYYIKLLIIQAISFLTLIIVYTSFLVKDYTNNDITAGDFSLVIGILLIIVDNLSGLSRNFYRFIEFFGNIAQGLDNFFIKEEVIDKDGAANILIKSGEIYYKNVNFKYNNSSKLFSNINLKIKGGSKVALVGYSGGGKSSFIKLLLRYYDLHSGSIEIDQQNISEITQDSLHKSISVIPQDISLFHRNIMENIRYGDPDANDEEVFEAARKANIHDFILTLENGYNSLVGERGVKLSGGQRQRIAIARSILKNAPILILDEATSHLDSISERLIQSSLYNLMKDKTTIVIAHRISTIMNLDRILVFDNGVIVEDGTHEDLVNNSKIYSKLWHTQIDGFFIDKSMDR